MVKLLFLGKTESNYAAMVKRLEVLQNSSHGPFDLVICCGKMFASKEEYEGVAPGLSLPIPTFVVDKLEDLGMDSSSSGSSSGPNNLHFLAAGLQDLCGLAVLYWPGTAPLDVLAAAGVVDVLVTPDWPRDMHHFMSDTDTEVLRSLKVGLGVGDAGVAAVATQVCPRYHVAGGRACFYQRPPYRNPTGRPCTRFVGLAPVSDSKDKTLKWLHALSLQPGNTMNSTELTAVPVGCSDSPYVDTSRDDDGPRAKRARWADELAGLNGSGGTAGIGAGEGNAFLFGAAAAKRNRPRTEAPSETATTLFVGNVPPNAVEIDVLATFPTAASCRKSDGKRFAFVTFEDHAKAKEVCDAANDTEKPIKFVIDNQVLNLGWAAESTPKQPRAPQKPREPKARDPPLLEPISVAARTLFFAGLPVKEDWADADLQAAVCPQAVQLKVIPQQTSSYAFAEFASPEEATAFLAAHAQSASPPTGEEPEKLMFREKAVEVSWSKHETITSAEKDKVGLLKDAPNSDCLSLFIMPMPTNVAPLALATTVGAASFRQPEGRAFAFLEFASHASAHAAMEAIAAGPVEVDGNQVEVSAGWARGKTLSKADHDAPCWFCLGSESAKTHLVVSVADAAYLALPRGGVHPLHALVIPIQCVPSRLHLSAEGRKDLLRYIKNVRAMHSDSGFSTFVFERALRTKGRDHMQTQCVPVPLQYVAGAVGKFLQAVGKLGVSFHELPEPANDEEDDELDTALLSLPGGPHQEYFFFQLPVGDGQRHRRFVHVPNPNVDQGASPMFLGMEVAAELLGDPRKARWKNNLLDEEGESKLAGKFREKFDKYDAAA